MEERKIYISSFKNLAQKGKPEPREGERVPPPPILISRTDHSLTFAPAAYDLERQVRFAFNELIFHATVFFSTLYIISFSLGALVPALRARSPVRQLESPPW